MRAVTSASNIFRRNLCPGSGFAEMGVLDEDSSYSVEGTGLHEVILSRISKVAPLSNWIVTGEQSDTLEEAELCFHNFADEVMDQFSIHREETFIDQVESTLIIRSEDGSELYRGHADLVRTWPGSGVRIIPDFKFFYGNQTDAAEHEQLSSYAVAAYNASPVLNTVVGIIQPRSFGQRVTRAIYGPAEIEAAQLELERIVLRSREQDAPRIAGEKQCRFCRARLFCDAYKAALVPAPVTDVSLVSNDQLERLHQAIQFAAAIEKKVKAELRERIRLGGMPGWELQSTGSVKTISDPAAAYRRLAETFPQNETLAEDFMGCMKPTWEKLTTLSSTLTGLPSKKARAKLEELFAGLIESMPKEATPKKL